MLVFTVSPVAAQEDADKAKKMKKLQEMAPYDWLSESSQ